VRRVRNSLSVVCLLTLVPWSTAAAQLARFPEASSHAAGPTTVYQGGFFGNQLGPGVRPLPPTGPGGTLGVPQQGFDQYNPGAASQPPAIAYPQTQDAFQQPYPAYPDGAQTAPYNQQPPALFPGGFGAGYFNPNGPNIDWNAPVRFIQSVSVRHTWLNGDGFDDVDINESEIYVTGNVPFLWTGEYMQLSPGFILNLWDGPAPPSTADLPSKSFSAYLDGFFEYHSPNSVLGAELGARVGVHSDFQTITTDSIRIQATGLATVQFYPNMQLKLGVVYLDRNKIKMLPAGGIIWTPDDYTRWEIFFPKPKFARRLSVVGTADVWWYVAGEYGGGSWTVERVSGLTNRIDINDIRITVGLEWEVPNHRTGWIEAGYVLDREVIYVESPADSFSMDDTFMLRAGFTY
jgi:hypothetical protein